MASQSKERAATVLSLRGQVVGMLLALSDNPYSCDEQRDDAKRYFEQALGACGSGQNASHKKQARIHVSLALFCDAEIER